MGVDKATLCINGSELAVRIATQLSRYCEPVTILGNRPVPGYSFLRDQAEHQGPLMAISQFVPTKPLVFMASCDMPLFNANVVLELFERLDGHDGCVPLIDANGQPLCGLYRSEAFLEATELAKEGERRLMAWLGVLRIKQIPIQELPSGKAVQSVNTFEQLEVALNAGVN